MIRWEKVSREDSATIDAIVTRGIGKHINRINGKLGDFFVPRFAVKQ